jgi:hypothetical protein
MIEQPHDRGMAELFLDPLKPCSGLLQITNLVRVGGDPARDAGLEQVPRGFGLAPAVKPGHGTEIDDERTHAAQRARQLVILPQRLVALGVRQDGHHALEAQLEQLIDHPGGHERRRNLHEERWGAAV